MTTAIADHVRRQVDALKRIDSRAALDAARRPTPSGSGYLLPLCDLHRNDERLIGLLAAWRHENAAAFPTIFPVTHEGTARWLGQRILDDPDRLLLLVCDPTDQPVGHVGLCGFLNERREAEAENIVRGVRGVGPGLMADAMRALLEWTYGLGVERVHLRVFQDNAHAIAFYHRLGFQHAGVQPLRKHVEQDVIMYRPVAPNDAAPPDKFFLRMVHVRS